VGLPRPSPQKLGCSRQRTRGLGNLSPSL
jgi:hypothetical protein